MSEKETMPSMLSAIRAGTSKSRLERLQKMDYLDEDFKVKGFGMGFDLHKNLLPMATTDKYDHLEQRIFSLTGGRYAYELNDFVKARRGIRADTLIMAMDEVLAEKKK